LSFSEVARTLSPGRFRRFIERTLDFSEGYDSRPYGYRTHLGVMKEDAVPPDIFRSILRYTDLSPNYMTGETKSRTRLFVVTHHLPSLTSDMNFLDVLTMDLKELKRSSEYAVLLAEASKIRNGDLQYYFGTNKDYFPQWKDHQDEWRLELGRMRAELNLPFTIDCIEPYTIGVNSIKEPESNSALFETLKQPDGIWIEITESGVNIRPFITADVMFSEPSGSAFVLNVDATPLAKERLTALEGLQDILTLEPAERRIEAFLEDHPEIFDSIGFVNMRPEVTIGPHGRPDFLLEREDGLWEILELKRVRSFDLFVEGQDGPPTLARYLKESLDQCARYLRILDTEEIRNRLREAGMPVGQPRVTLLIGRPQYPKSVLEFVKQKYGERIVLRSFEGLFEECKKKFAVLLRAMNDLA